MSENQDTDTGAPALAQTAEDAFACNGALIDALRAKHGDVEVLFQRGLGIIVVATPARKDFRAFLDKIANDKVSNAAAADELALASVVHPDRETTKGYFDKKPGLPVKIAGLAQALSGAEADILGKD